AVIGQRLVRKICPNCKEPVADPAMELERLDLPVPEDRELTLFRGAGCDECRHTGYKGRQAIYEVMVIDESFHTAIIEEAPTTELEAIARAGGMKSMLEDGLGKAMDGLTTVEEVLRTVR
ncbi:MAG: type II/IV secretion system protein, partial [Pseudomonadota bacterium]